MTNNLKKRKMNKKGDIPTLILVIGVFLVCGLAIISFGISFNSTKQSFEILENMVAVNSIAEQARFYENVGLKPEDILDLRRQGNFYNITSEKVLYGDRVIYIQHLMPVKNP